MQFESPHSKRRRVSLTPLIDVVFLLLVFFMLATSFMESRSITLETPAQASKRSTAPKSIRIRVESATLYRVAEREVAPAELEDVLRSVLLESEEPKVIIEPEEGVQLQTVVAVLDTARSAGAESVTLRKPSEK